MILITTIILLLSLHYFVFILRIAWGIYKVKSEVPTSPQIESVTLIVVFRNEENNLKKLIHSLDELEHYKEFEAIFVNDNSTDNSVDVINETIKISNYKIIDLFGNKTLGAHKKLAIEQAVELASGEIIFITDADCILPPKWVRSILNYFAENVAFVTGPVTFSEGSSLFQKFQQLEYAGLNLVGAGLIGINKPKLASAANLAFRKKVFLEIGGYDGYRSFTSGDDEFLMQKIKDKTSYSIKYAFDRDAVVETKGNDTISEFAHQRQRWASKSLFYKDKGFVIQLLLIMLFYICIPVSFILGMFLDIIFLLIFFTSVVLKVIPEFIVLRNGAQFLFDKSLLRIFILAQLIQIPYIIISSLMGLKGNYTWKGRKVQR
jgi:cellulose synthase/poly-beta-1,6-N-acetylglucosamine synthase-like glycosyltransferase